MFKKIRIKLIDKKFEKLGYIKTNDSKYCVTYERYDEKYNYIREIDISHKENVDNQVTCYDKTTRVYNEKGEKLLFSPVSSMNITELKLAYKRLKLTFKDNIKERVN